MRLRRPLAWAGAFAAALGTVFGTVFGTTTPSAAAPTLPILPQPTLTAIRAGHHPGFDRLVFEFRGALPTQRSIAYVPRVIADPSGLPVPLAGDVFLRLRFFPAVGHTATGQGTYGPSRRTFALPEVIQVANAGDFEAVLSFGIGVARREPVRMFALSAPSRVVVDITSPVRTVPVKDYFLDLNRFARGIEPYTRPVLRPVIPPGTARGALQRLFAGPTQSELASGLRFVASGADGFRDLGIADGVARVTLTGGCSSGGSTFTVAGEILPTLKQFPGVHWVKIYDPSGHTERPSGHTDSIPVCLEP